MRPLEDKVLMHAVLLILKSQTLMKAELTVKAMRVAAEYLTHTTLLGWPPRLFTSSLRHKSHTLTVRSLEALNSNSSVAKTLRTAFVWPSATLEQIRGLLGEMRPWYG